MKARLGEVDLLPLLRKCAELMRPRPTCRCFATGRFSRLDKVYTRLPANALTSLSARDEAVLTAIKWRLRSSDAVRCRFVHLGATGRLWACC